MTDPIEILDKIASLIEEELEKEEERLSEGTLTDKENSANYIAGLNFVYDLILSEIENLEN